MNAAPRARSGLEFCATIRPRAEMIDYNGHLNVGYYGVVFEEAARAIFPRYDLSDDYKTRTNHALFATEAHFSFRKEVFEAQPIDFYLRLVDLTEKALHVAFLMFHRDDEDPAAIQEVLYLHVDLANRKVVPMEAKTQAALAELTARQLVFPLKAALGRKIELRRPPQASAEGSPRG